MAAPVGIDRDQVLDAAQALVVERERVAAVSLGDVAKRLHIRTQSLYAHVDGLDGLRRALALRAQAALASTIGAAPRSLEGIVRAHVAFATDHPGLYDATLRAPRDDEELAGARTVMAPLRQLLSSAYGLDGGAALHWYRVIFAGVHGFIVLQRDGLLTLPGDPAESLDRMIRAFEHELEREADEVRSAGRRSER